MGGAAAAVEAYRTAPTPNVIVLEADGEPRRTDRAARELSPNFATPAPRSIVIGRVNDITLYRELISRGVSDYLVAAVQRDGFRRGASRRSIIRIPPSRSAASSPSSGQGRRRLLRRRP